MIGGKVKNNELKKIAILKKIDVSKVYYDQSYEEYIKISKKNKSFINEIKNEEDIKKFNYKSNCGINLKIFNIIKKLEEIVKFKRSLYKDNSFKGKIYLYEREEVPEGFILYDFNHNQKTKIENDIEVWGMIEFEKILKDNPRGYAYGFHQLLISRDTKRGYGPLLLEILLEYVSFKDSAIVCDRNSISEEGQKRFMIYSIRSDVEKIQLDLNKYNFLLYKINYLEYKNKKARTDQSISISHKGKNWYNSIFSKALQKKSFETLKYIKNYSKYLEVIMDISK